MRGFVGVWDGSGQDCNDVGIGDFEEPTVTDQTNRIAFLATVAKAQHEPLIQKQLPRALRYYARALVLCPPSLIDQWRADFKNWKPASVGLALYVVGPDTAQTARMNVINAWAGSRASVLLMTLDIFRGYFSTTDSANLSSNCSLELSLRFDTN